MNIASLAGLVGVHAAVDELLGQPTAEDRTEGGNRVNHGDGKRPDDQAGHVDGPQQFRLAERFENF